MPNQIKGTRHSGLNVDSLIDARYSGMDGTVVDAFGRQRVSTSETIFDSKQIFDNQPLFWDDQEVSGGGTGSTYTAAEASTAITVGTTTAGVRTRQTFQRFNYQPGKGQVATMTGILSAGANGIITSIGLIDDNDGLAFETVDGVVSVLQRTSTSGSPVDTARFAQADWNLDRMDGTGVNASGVTIDFSKTQIFIIDFQYLGVGRVRFGFNIAGITIWCHEIDNSNVIELPYMSTPNLPLRYSVTNDGTGPATAVVHMCTTVYSDGGQENTGALFYESTTTNRSETHVEVSADVADVLYPIVGLKLKAAYIGMTVDLVAAAMLEEAGNDFEWVILLNPTVTGTFVYGDKTNSALQTAIGATATIADGSEGTVLSGGYMNSSAAGGAGGAITIPLRNAIRLGSNIANVVDAIVLAVRPLAINADVHGGLNWRELS